MDRRGDAPVVGVLLLVAVVVVLATTASGYVLSDAGDVPSPSPQVGVSHVTVADGSERTVVVTLESGDAVRLDKLSVVGSKPVDVGGPPGNASPADETDASSREAVAERTGIGETWDAGETVSLDPTGDAAGVTVRLYWNTRPVEGGDPVTVTGDDASLLAEFTARPAST